MGFKRTSEGRIFFQSPDDGANDTANDSPKTMKSASAPRPQNPGSALQSPGQSSPQTQMQIVALLKTLNERLKITQAERDKMSRELETTRTLIEELQQKASTHEQAYRDLQSKISKGPAGKASENSHAEILARDALAELEETRKMLQDLETKATRADHGVSALKKLQLEQAEKMAVSVNHAAALTKRVKDAETRQEEIGARVDDAIGQQARLSRKIDKAVEERTRFMRKLERIEETVLQTRDSLNAKAMVLLTDQGVAAQQKMESAAPLELNAQNAQILSDFDKETDSKIKPQTMQAIGMGLLLVAALLGGYLMNELQSRKATTDIQPAAHNTQTTQETASNTTASAPMDMTEMEWGIDDDTSAFNAQGRPEPQGTPPQKTVGDDIGTLDLNDQNKVEALLSDNPDAVAGVMNDIEPGSETLPDTLVVSEAAEETQTPPAEQAQEPAAAAQPAPKPDAIENAQLPKPTDPHTGIKPDPSLPANIKAIEDKAFEGVPEAQHDLAAIYTAGHGGVKQDYKRAAFWFEQAATRGVANAAYNLGVLNHQGLGMKADLGKAIEWYGYAAQMGHPEAQYNLGIAYIEGIGVPYDAQKAASYFESAAQNDIMEAAYNLGLIYENGLLGEAEPDKALYWYKRAADAGSPEAKEALEQLAKSLNVSVDDVNALAESVQAGAATAAPQNVEPAAGQPAAQPVSSVTSNQQAITAQVQEYLMRMGLYPGPADGITGPLTQDAIRSYQRLHGLAPDGEANQGLLSHMLANAIEQGTSQ